MPTDVSIITQVLELMDVPECGCTKCKTGNFAHASEALVPVASEALVPMASGALARLPPADGDDNGDRMEASVEEMKNLLDIFARVKVYVCLRANRLRVNVLP